MKSLILRTATRFMLPLLLLFSVFLLLRGHNEPGGGFCGGLMAASAFVLYALAYGAPEARSALPADPRILIGAGLLIALGSGLLALLRGQPFLTGQDAWVHLRVTPTTDLTLGPPLFFDAGVYLVVVGATLSILLPLVEE